MRNFRISPEEMGYTLKDGRLINMAPCPDMGITKLAQMRKDIKRAKKVSMIAEGTELAQARMDLLKRL